MSEELLLAIDAGTGSCRAVLFSASGAQVAIGQREYSHPAIPGVEAAIAKGLVRVCPICDGYEVIGKSVGVIGDDDHSAAEALFLTTYTDRVTLIHTGPAERLSEWFGWPYAEELRKGTALVAALRGRCDVILHGHRHTPRSSTFMAFIVAASATRYQIKL